MSRFDKSHDFVQKEPLKFMANKIIWDGISYIGPSVTTLSERRHILILISPLITPRVE